MLINLSELFPVEGKSKTYDLELEMTQFHAPDGVYGIVEKHPFNLDVYKRQVCIHCGTCIHMCGPGCFDGYGWRGYPYLTY